MPGVTSVPATGAPIATTGAVFGRSVRMSCGFFVVSRLWYFTQVVLALTSAKS